MSSLAKQIESYLKALLDQESAGVLEIQRNFLSEYFHCVPSQINYVLSTRFTPTQGYIVETRRGGGGFVRIVSLQLESQDDLQALLTEGVGEQIGERDSEGMMAYLTEQGLLTSREKRLISSMLKDRVISSGEQTDHLRAKMLQQLFATMSLELY